MAAALPRDCSWSVEEQLMLLAIDQVIAMAQISGKYPPQSIRSLETLTSLDSSSPTRLLRSRHCCRKKKEKSERKES